VFVPLAQRLRVKREQAFERIDWVKPHRLYPSQLAARADKLVMTFRQSMAAELERADCLSDGHAVWSMWPGYLDGPRGTQMRAWLDKRGIPLTVAHSSGHASVDDLRRFAEAVSAHQVIPIHTAAPHRFPDLFANAVVRDDGLWWSV
jgi:ribonuclease J